MSTGWFNNWVGSRADLKNNRWEPAADELAIYFNASELKGIATKTLRIPGGCEARVLADNQVRQLNEGEETLENLWERINSLFAGKHAEILITRRAALAVPFTLRDLNCGDLNRINAQLVLRIQVGDVEAFHNHFMRQPGSVNIAQLQALLDAAVRQAVSEFTHKRTRDEVLADAGQTRSDLNNYLDGSLKRLMAEFGLALQAMESVEWDYLPTADDREKEANAARRKATWQRYQQGCTEAEEAESAATLREREIELLNRVTNAATREQAIKLGAADALAALEAEYGAQQRAREHERRGEEFRTEDEQAEWTHLKEIAAIRRDGLKIAEEETQRQQAALAREQFESALQLQQLQAALSQAEFVADADTREQLRQATTASQLLATQRADELKRKQQDIDIDVLNFENEIRRQEKVRVQILEDARAAAEIAGLEQTVESNQAKIDAERNAETLRLAQEAETNKLDNELREFRGRSEIERENKSQQADLDLQKLMASGGVPLTALLANMKDADPKILEAMVEIHRVETLAKLGPEAIAAMNGGRQSAGPDKMDTVIQQLTGLVGSLATKSKPQSDTSTREMLDYFLKVVETMISSMGGAPMRASVTPPSPGQSWAAAPQPNVSPSSPPQAPYAPGPTSGPGFAHNFGTAPAPAPLPGLHPLDLDIVALHWPLKSPSFQISFVNDAGAPITTAHADTDYRRADTYRLMVTAASSGYLTLIGQGTSSDYFLLAPNLRGKIGLRRIDTGSHSFPGHLLFDTTQLSEQQRRLYFTPPYGNERVLALLTATPLFNQMMEGLAPLSEGEVVRLILEAHSRPGSQLALAKVVTRP